MDARAKKSIIFCTQYENEGWYARINSSEESEATVSDAIMDRIVHNSFTVSLEGKISMRERHGINFSENAVPEFGGTDVVF